MKPKHQNRHVGDRYEGYVTTIRGVDVHHKDDWVCVVWGNGSDEWNGWRVSHWVRRPSPSNLNPPPPGDTHAELLAFIIPFCQLHS